MTGHFSRMTRRLREGAHAFSVFALCTVATMVLPVTLSAISQYAA